MKAKRMRHSGFSFIELLVTVGILSVLASLLLPSLIHAKSKSKSIKCLSNARQLGIGLMLYVSDHEETYPPSADYSAATDDPERIWNTKLIKYLESTAVYACPSFRNFIYPSNWAARGHGSIGYTTATLTIRRRWKDFRASRNRATLNLHHSRRSSAIPAPARLKASIAVLLSIRTTAFRMNGSRNLAPRSSLRMTWCPNFRSFHLRR